MDDNQLQQLIAQVQPKANPEDQYLSQLGAQPSQPIEYDPNAFLLPQNVQSGSSEKGLSSVGGLEDRYNRAANLADSQHGLASLGGAIYAMFLGPKVRKAQAGAEANRIRAQGLEMEKADLANQTQRQQLELEKPKIEQQKGLTALSNIQLGLSKNIQEDIKVAKGELNENGTPKTFFHKFQEQMSQGKYGNIDLKKLAMFDPSIVNLGGQIYSQYTQDAFNTALNNAAKLQQKHDSDLMEVKKASISKGETQLDAWKAYGNLVENYAKGATALADYSIDPEIKNEIYENLQQTAKAINTMGTRYGLVDKNSMLIPGQLPEAVNQMQNGNQDMFMQIMSMAKDQHGKASMMAKKPIDSPDRLKTKESPMAVGTTSAPVNQKALQVLGE